MTADVPTDELSSTLQKIYQRVVTQYAEPGKEHAMIATVKYRNEEINLIVVEIRTFKRIPDSKGRSLCYRLFVVASALGSATTTRHGAKEAHNPAVRNHRLRKVIFERGLLMICLVNEHGGWVQPALFEVEDTKPPLKMSE